MPFLPYTDSEEEKKKKQGDVQHISGQSTSFNNQPPGSNENAQGTKTSSGQYTNINKYIDANASQAQDMGTKLTSQVENQAQKATQEIRSLDNKVAKPTNLDPTAYLDNPLETSYDEYSKLKSTGGYEGPEDISEIKGLDNVAKRVDNASQKVNAIGSEQGLDALLQQEYKRPDYSRGQRSLDNVLVRSDEGNINQINNLQKKYSNINQMFDNSTTQLGNTIAEAKGQALENKKKFAPAEAAAFERLLDPIKDRVEEYNQTAPDRVSAIRSDFSDDTLTEQTLSQLGITPDELGVLYDTNLSNYIKLNETEAGVNDFANAEERAKYAALAQLAGDSSRSQITEDGYRDLSPATFDMEGFLAGRDDRKQSINSEFLQNRDRFTSELINDITKYETGGKGGSQLSVQANVLFDKMRNSKSPEEFGQIRAELQNLIRSNTNSSEENISGTGRTFDNWMNAYGFNRRLKESK